MTRLLIASLAGLLVLTACGEPLTEHEEEIHRIEKQTEANLKEAARLRRELGDTPATEPAPLPSYTVITDEMSQPAASQPMKRTVEIRLQDRIARDDLEGLGYALRAGSEHKDRLFITYYLPDQTPGEGAWASTHFTPEPEVKIYGMTLEQANDPFPKLSDGQTELARFNGNELLGEKSILVRQADGGYAVVSRYKDGSDGTSPLYSTDGRRFETRNDFGEYYVLSDTNIASYDADGLLHTYRLLQE